LKVLYIAYFSFFNIKTAWREDEGND